MRRPIVRLRALGVAALVVIVSIGAGFTARPAGADDVSDQQQQVKDDLAEIERLERRASELNEEYLGYLNEQAALEAEIATGEQQLGVRQAELTALEAQLAAVAIQQFTGGGGDGLAMFGDSSNATASLQREQLVRTAVNAGSASTDEYEVLLDELNAEQDDLEAKRARVSELAERAADTLERTEQAGREYQDKLARDQALLGDLLIEEQRRQEAEAAAKHAAEVAAAQAAQERAAQERAAQDQAAQDQAAQDQAAQDRAAQDQPAQDQPAQDQPAQDGSAPTTSSGAATTSTPTTAGGNGGGPITPATVAPTTTTEAPPATDDQSADEDFGATEAITVEESGTGSSDAGSSDAGSNAGSTDSGSADPGAGEISQAPPPASSRAEVAVAAARSQLGVPYKFASSSPGVAFDCSGLTAYAWAQAGVSLPHQSAMQFGSSPHVPISDIQPGDLLYYYSPISHVAMYIGNGQQIHAPAPGKFVEIVNVSWGKLVGASRPG